MCGQYSILCLVFDRLNVLYLSSCNVCDYFDQLWCLTLFLTKVVYLLLRSWQGTRGEFHRPTKCEFRKRTPGGYLWLFVYVLLWNCAKTSPGEHQFEKVFGGGVCLICLLGCFCAERFSLKCREKSVQCLINRICKFVTSHNFSVERHICMVTPIFFSHRKYF